MRVSFPNLKTSEGESVVSVERIRMTICNRIIVLLANVIELVHPKGTI
jgi:hypothetical protein